MRVFLLQEIGSSHVNRTSPSDGR